MSATVVTTPAELAGAISSGAEIIEVQGTISGSPMITLPPGVTLRAGTLEFGAKGVRLTKDNTLDAVTVLTTDDEVAILNDTDVPELGTLTLRDVTARGQVLLVADDQVRAGHIQIAGLHYPPGSAFSRSCAAPACGWHRRWSAARRTRVDRHRS